MGSYDEIVGYIPVRLDVLDRQHSSVVAGFFPDSLVMVHHNLWIINNPPPSVPNCQREGEIFARLGPFAS
jgi:hypothetical protein